MKERKKTRPLFIGLYDTKIMGIRYLSSSLKAKGYETNLIFLKTFNSYNVEEPTSAEYDLLYKQIKELNPSYVGISFMCTFYKAVVKKISEDIRGFSDVKILIGGANATLFPEECLEYGDVVFRGECEDAIVEFTDALENGAPYSDIENVSIKTPDGVQINPIRVLQTNLDTLKYPDYGGNHMYYINNNKITKGDPVANSHSYELATSRGCPNRCSYCSTSTIRDIHKGKGPFIRQRTVDDVMAELAHVKTINKGLQMLRFWDEIFPWNKKWVAEFAEKYKAQVNLPFEVWGNPRLSGNLENLKKLVDAGLSKIVIGIQSGDPIVRKEIYNRPESQEEILACANAFKLAKVPIVIYDFMLGHPFETSRDLKVTLDLCRSFPKPFRLQLHGLSFLPNTPIEQLAVDKGVKTWDEIRAEQNRPLKEQYHAMAWWRQGHGANSSEKVYWYTLIYLTQFPTAMWVINLALKSDKLKQNPALLQFLHKIYNRRLQFQMGTRKLKFLALNLLKK